MADILLKRDSTLAATYVPNTFIDEYMTHADGEFVKIYLYLLRCMNNPDTVFSISDIADKFDHTEKDVTRALKYWEKMRLLRLEFNKQAELTGICLSDFTSSKMPRAAQEAEPALPADTCHTEQKHKLPERTEYSRNQLALLSESESVQEILFVTERYLGHPLNNTEIQMILYWLDKLKFSPSLVEYLIEQCVAKNHLSIRYMDKIALSWAEAGIRTLTDAKQALQHHGNAVYAVQKAFGISNRTLAEAELKYVHKWSEELGFSDEVIALACEKTILRIHQISFDYADSILQNWKQHNVRTLNDVKLLDAQYQEAKAKKVSAGKAAVRTAKGTCAGGFANFSQRTYNYEELERELLSQAR
ncbi:MAG: DnaD domain protein [Eubacterium sp.]|nr:DnaD domain protein [Eubacterium sp.]